MDPCNSKCLGPSACFCATNSTSSPGRMGNPRCSHASSNRKKPFPKRRWSLPPELDIHASDDLDITALRVARDASALAAIGRTVYGALVEQLIAADGGDANHTFRDRLETHFERYAESAGRCDLDAAEKNCFPNFPFTFGMSSAKLALTFWPVGPATSRACGQPTKNLNTNGRKAGRVCCQRNAPKCAAPKGNRTVITRHPCTTVGKLSTRCWRT